MRHRLGLFGAFLLFGVLAIAVSGCASGQIRLFQRDPQPPGPDQDTVVSIICSASEARIADAWLYLERRGASAAEATERIERAKKKCDCWPSCERPATPPAK